MYSTMRPTTRQRWFHTSFFFFFFFPDCVTLPELIAQCIIVCVFFLLTNLKQNHLFNLNKFHRDSSIPSPFWTCQECAESKVVYTHTRARMRSCDYY